MASQSLHQPSLPLSLADGSPPYDSPPRRSRSTARNDFELVPRWQRKDMEELPDDSSAAGSSSFSKSLGGSPSLTPGDSISNVGDNCKSRIYKSLSVYSCVWGAKCVKNVRNCCTYISISYIYTITKYS